MRYTGDALSFSVNNLRRRGQWLPSGTMTWSTGQRLAYKITAYKYEAELVLDYCINDQPVRQRIAVETTEQRLGCRWWFLCPSCGRRVGVLYLPARATQFRCRECYGLRYRSQDKDLDFLLRPLAAAAGVRRRDAREMLAASLRQA